MRNLTQDNITQAVIARLADTPDARLRELMTSLVQHLHAFTDIGRKGEEQEFILLSDRLGLSLLAGATHVRNQIHKASP